MNKKEMAAALAKRSGLSQVKALEILNVVFDAKEPHRLRSEERREGHHPRLRYLRCQGERRSRGHQPHQRYQDADSCA